jgi:23S rRNA pseudouridine2457 synthase
MPKLILFNKPCGVLSQFSSEGKHQTLAAYIDKPGYYPAGRLDKDSEGLLLLTNDGKFQQQITDPKYKQGKTYLVQLEGMIDEPALEQLRNGVALKDGITRPAQAGSIVAPNLWPRTPPVRHRENVPTCWIEITIYEGKNRQIRRMTAAVGYPTLRLVRTRIGAWQLANLAPGEWRLVDVDRP